VEQLPDEALKRLVLMIGPELPPAFLAEVATFREDIERHAGHLRLLR
jgi:hypothetical protein